MIRTSREDGPSLGRALVPACLVLATVAAYINSFGGTFVFDDERAILENPHIRGLWPLSLPLTTWPDSSLAGRPVASLSFALSYALSGAEPWGHHAVNLAVHLLAGLLLFGIVRRTLAGPRLEARFGRASNALAGAAAGLWLLHPIQTQAVTYIVQRCESLMGLFYLATIYAVVRALSSPAPAGWGLLAVAFCALGMGTKEAMVTAPVLAVLYDRTFGAGSLGGALRRRWPLHAGLASTWLILAALMAPGPRSSSTGFGLATVTWWEYARSQFGVVAHYLRLSVWPSGLALDYGWPVAQGWREILPPMAFVGALAALTAVGLARNRPWSYLGAWFFGILAPTSSVVPIRALAFEHRMYLPLAAVAVGAVLAVRSLEPRLIFARPGGADGSGGGGAPASRRLVTAAVLAMIVLAGLTFQRNTDYESAERIWRRALEVAPGNPRAHNNLAVELIRSGHFRRAAEHLREALRLAPEDPEAHQNLAMALESRGKSEEALEQYRRALAIQPNHFKARVHLGVLLASDGSYDGAIQEFRKAVRIDPSSAVAFNNLGAALASEGRLREAVRRLRTAVELDPGYAEAHRNLGMALQAQGEIRQAITHLRKAVRLAPEDGTARRSLDRALAEAGSHAGP